MHNVRVAQLEGTRSAASEDATAALMSVNLAGEWRADEASPQFGGTVPFPAGEAVFEADFPPFLGGEGRAPSPLAYCFYGAMSCYGATFATQAAMAGVKLRGLRISLALNVDFRAALGLGERPPLDRFVFRVEVDTDAPDERVQEIKALADARCPAIWAMENPVPYSTEAVRA